MAAAMGELCARVFMSKVWRQPSDQAALVLTLIRIFGRQAVEVAWRDVGPTHELGDQKCFFISNESGLDWCPASASR